MTDRYDELRAAAEAATPGPWNYEGRVLFGEQHVAVTSGAEIIFSEVGSPLPENAALTTKEGA